jgi:predicted aspartyl protease
MNVLHRWGRSQFVALATLAFVLLLLLTADVGEAVESPSVLPPDPDEPMFAAPTRLDRVGRVLAPVMVNGKGPFRFVLDTGANYSTVSPLLVSALGLEMAPEEQARMVHGVTGSARVSTVHIDKLEAGTMVLQNAYMPVVQTSINLRAHGILGVAGLQQARVFVDFRHDSVVISRTRVRREDLSSYFVIDASRMEDGLLAVNANVRGVRAKAIIDTGAERTLGNIALRDAIRARHRHHGESRFTEVYGATDQVAEGEAELPATISIGDISVNHVEVTYGDFHIFEAWNLKDRPAMLIGMDVLGVADALVIDFRSRQILVKRASGQ